MAIALSLDRREFEAGKYRDQVLTFEWLSQRGSVGVAVSRTVIGIADRVDKRYSTRAERLRHRVAVTTIQVHIQHGEVEGLRINQSEGLVDRRGRCHRLASKVGQHVFNHYKNQHLILDNEAPPTGKQLIHREYLLVRECPSCRRGHPACSRDVWCLPAQGPDHARSPAIQIPYVTVGRTAGHLSPSSSGQAPVLPV